MDKIVNDAHTSKLQTLQNYYAAEDVLVFDIETTGFTVLIMRIIAGKYVNGSIRMASQKRRFCVNSFCFVKISNILLHITAMGLIFLT